MKNKMKIITGFNSIKDFIGDVFFHFLEPSIKISLIAGVILKWLSDNTGLNPDLLIVFLLGSFVDIFVGWYVNVKILGLQFSSTKMYRGLFKIIISPILLIITMSLKNGFYDTNIEQGVIKNAIDYIVGTIHYGTLFFIMLFVLIGLAENLSKADIKWAKKLMKILESASDTVQEKITKNTNNEKQDN